MNEYNPFQHEEEVIEEVESFLASENPFDDPAKTKEIFTYLYGSYSKLFKNTKRLVKMSDKREAEMAKLNIDLKHKNELLNSLSSKLSKYLSPQLYDSIFHGTQDVKLESKRKKLTVFFSDIVGFTETSERLESEELTNSLNNYLNEMTNVALLYGATIDKYIGDAIMVFFGDPKSEGVKEDAVQCVKMALAMRKRLEELRADSSMSGIFKSFDIRMGISTGYCTVGNFGSEDRMDYTIIGRAVNVASRLESNAGSNEILISDETYNLVKDEIYCREAGEFDLKGVAYKMRAYKAIDLHDNLKADGRVFTKETEGYSIHIDTNKLKLADRLELVNYIERLLLVMSTKARDQ